MAVYVHATSVKFNKYKLFYIFFSDLTNNTNIKIKSDNKLNKILK